MTKITATMAGVLLIFLGTFGFAFPSLFEMHFTATNNLLHLLSGALALLSGTIGSVLAARAFCSYFGLFYGSLGLLGFLGTGADRLVMPIPHQLIFGTMDHVEHLVLGGVMLVASLYGKYEVSAFNRENFGFHKSSHHP